MAHGPIAGTKFFGFHKLFLPYFLVFSESIKIRHVVTNRNIIKKELTIELI